jgi:pimeloyl-ACP methyl ester carboxylesterase
VLRANVTVIKKRPSLMLKLQRCPADLDALRSARPEIASLSYMAESVHRGLEGPVHDAWILAGPWGFEPEDVKAQVHLWHGDQDPTIPLRHSEELATLLPHAHLRVCPGEGHLLYAGHLAEIMAAATGVQVG